MARRAGSHYIDAAIKVLTELGGGPISSKDLHKATEERGLIGTTKYVYHNFLRKVRGSELFDTSIRGQISLVPGTEPNQEETPASAAPSTPGAPSAALIGEILAHSPPETSSLDISEEEESDIDETQVNTES